MAASTNKTVSARASVSAFITAVENAARRQDAKVLTKMIKEISGEKPAMWIWRYCGC